MERRNTPCPSRGGETRIFLLIALLWLANAYPSFAQDRVDPRPLDSTLFADTAIYDKDFHKRHFIRGWNFGGETKKLDSALRINYYLSGFKLKVLMEIGLNDTLNLKGHRKAYQYYEIFGNRQADYPFNGHSLYLKPYITVDTNNFFEAKPDEGTGAVFGFLNKAIGDTATEVIGSDTFKVFTLNRSAPNLPQIVLKDIWKNDLLRYLNYSGLDSLVNGTRWYLTVNLRSRDTIIPSNLYDSTILTIKIKYKTNKNTTDSIRFWRFPSDSLKHIIDSRGNTLGLARDPGMDTNTIEIKEWQIKGKHLVTGGINQAGKLITLSAEFYNYGISDSLHPVRYNPLFLPEGNNKKVNDTMFITNIDVEVIYHGHLDLSINYIRIETPRAQEIFRGKHDKWLANKIDTLNKIVKNPAKNRCDARIHRLYTQDEPIPSEWATTRYVNKLLNGMGVVETSIDVDRFLHATDFDMMWMGATLSFDMRCAPPYIRAGKLRTFNRPVFTRDFVMADYFGFQKGYKGQIGINSDCPGSPLKVDTTLNDTLHSGYEFDFGDDFEKGIFPTTTAVLKDYHKVYTNLLYSGKPWYAFLWITPRISFNPSFKHTCDSINYYIDSAGFSFLGFSTRPKTSEETRLMMWKPILLGAKGLFYYKTKYNKWNDNTWTGLTTEKVNKTSLTGEALVYSDSIGGDYIDITDTNSNGETYGLGRWFNSRLYSWETLGIDSNHIYVGLKSNRAEIMKLHHWVETVEDTLLKLRLLAWYYQGWYAVQVHQDSSTSNYYTDTNFYSQDPKITYSDTLLGKFVKLNSIKTKRLDTQEFDNDSLKFFLISLFAYGDDTLKSIYEGKTFVIGILNPRTDPLVRTFDTVWDYPDHPETRYILFIDSSMKFYSTAEYDIGIRYGNYTHIRNPQTNSYEWRDTSYWQNLWWKRQGSREIRIPFNLVANEVLCSCGSPAYYTVRVTELGANDTNLNKEFWRDPRFYHRVDTVLYGFTGGENYYLPWPYHDYTLRVRLLPGEGKILKVKASYECPTHFAGLMTPKFQIKTVTHPIGYAQQWRRDSIYYHLVYHRTDTLNHRSKVYYRRSLPLFPDSNNIPKIIWSPEICLSDSIRCWRDPAQIITNADCAYPSLVVRYDSVSERTRVYVTFVCRDADSLSNFNDCYYSYQARDNCSNTDYSVIAECVFNADDTIQSIPPAQAIHWACGDNYSQWGVPVVNASRYGNYYAWADSLHGIVSGYKRPNQSEFPIGFNFDVSSFKFNPNGIAINPSVTSYSRIFYNEDGTPIVWQEKSNPYSLPNVYYSLLKADTSGLFVRHYLPSGIGNNNSGFAFNLDSSIVELGLNTEIAEQPVIYRDVKDSLQPPGPQQILDLVAWGSQRTDTIPNCRFVRTITLQHFLNNGEIVTTSIKPRVSLHTDFTNYNLRYPVLSQGSSGTLEINQGPAILETIVEDSCPSGADFEKKVLHIPYDYFITDPPNSEIIHSGANLVQLARRPFVSIQNDWWQNFRLLQKDSSIGEFCQSTQKFWRRAEEEPKFFVFFGFCDTTGTHSIANILVDNNLLKWNSKSIFPELDPTNRYNFIPFVRRDTFFTEWFRPGDISTLNLVLNRTSNASFNLMIQRKSDNQRMFLPANLEPASKVRILTYQLLNRTPDEMYRFVITKNNPSTNFCQEIILMPDPFDENFVPRNAFSPTIIDLGTMDKNYADSNKIEVTAYPNPTDGNIYLTATLPAQHSKATKRIKLSIYNPLGIKIYEMEIASGETTVFSTSELPSGLYWVTATANVNIDENLFGYSTFLIFR